jgi:hypothetical protein
MKMAFAIQNSSGVTAYSAVVANGTAEQCALPSGANAAEFLGFAENDEPNQYAAVTVKMDNADGESWGIAAGAITAGHYVNIADSSGRLQDCDTAVLATSGGPSIVHVCGRALSTVANANSLVKVEIIKFSKVTPT